MAQMTMCVQLKMFYAELTGQNIALWNYINPNTIYVGKINGLGKEFPHVLEELIKNKYVVEC